MTHSSKSAGPVLPFALNRMAIFWVLLLLFSASRAADSQPPVRTERAATFWLIPHTDWEGAVFKTREEYLEMGLPHILTAVRLLKKHPDYRFTLDQVAYLKLKVSP